MAKPPADADPEKFIFGTGTYSNLQLATPHFGDGIFRLDPSPVPVVGIVSLNCLFAAACFGLYWLLKYHTHGEAGPWAVYGVPIALGLLTCIAFTTTTCYFFRKESRLGPWLIYDTAKGQLTLPREGITFQRSEIVHLQYITTKRLDWGGVINNDQLSELNLVTCQNGVRKRWPLLRSIFNIRPFDALLKPLLEHTDLPVVRVNDQWLGWKVTERTYGRQPKS